MEIPFGSDVANQFITVIGLITTHGVHGQNIMACEWTNQISYRPGLIAVSVNPRHATYQHIKESKEFGVGICANDQSVLASVAGKESGRNVHKLKILEELGFKFTPGLNISAMMCEGTSANMECKLVNEVSIGDHTLFIGEVLHATHSKDKVPLAYHGGKYWILDTHAAKPEQAMREKIKSLHDLHRK